MESVTGASATGAGQRHRARPAHGPARGGPPTVAAAATYVLAWIVGLLVAPAAPDAYAPAARIAEFYAGAPAAVFVQSWLVHGIAGAALLVVAVSAARALTGAGAVTAGRTALVAGTAAVTVSFAQVFVLHVLGLRADMVDAATSEAWFDVLNRADSLKLVLVAAFAVVVSVTSGRRRLLPRWLVALGVVLAALLPLGALAFLVDSSALYSALVASLVALLTWVGGLGLALARGRRATPAPAVIPRQR